MARYPVVSTATIVLTNPNAGGLLAAITTLQAAENQFYRERRNLVNSYPMKTQDISTSDIEALYDQHLGSEPWHYKDRFDASGSTLKSGAYEASSFWVDDWGTTPVSSSYPETRNNEFLFDPQRGAAWVDLIGRYGYTNGFTRTGGSRTASVTSGAGDGASTTYYPVYAGFGVIPIAYNGRNGLSGFEAHMLKLVGDAYEDTVRTALRDYRGRLNDYQNSNGSTTATFTPTSAVQPWSGFTGTTGGYNRPDELVAELVRETRGTN